MQEPLEATTTLERTEKLRCRHCRCPLRIEWRDEWTTRPPGHWSLAGQQVKATATHTVWPWAVCDGCGLACKGEASRGPQNG